MKRLKILKFKINEYIDLNNGQDVGCNVIQCGKDRYTIKDFKRIGDYDDRVAYTAVLCLNNKPFCKCSNDGFCGLVEIEPVDIQAKAVLASTNIKLSKYGWRFRGGNFKLELDFIADTLAMTEAITESLNLK